MSKSPLKKLQQQLITACDNEHFATTVRLADEYLAVDSGSIKAMLDKAHALSKMARGDQALAVYQSAIETIGDGQNPDVIFGEIGNLYRSRGDFPKAIQFYEKQIAADPDDATGYLFLGTLLLQMEDVEKSQQVLQRGLECEIGCLEEVHYAIGCSFRSQGRYDQACASFEQSLRLAPNDPHVKAALKDMQQCR